MVYINDQLHRSFWIVIQDIDAAKKDRASPDYKYRSPEIRLETLNGLCDRYTLHGGDRNRGACTGQSLYKSFRRAWRFLNKDTNSSDHEKFWREGSSCCEPGLLRKYQDAYNKVSGRQGFPKYPSISSSSVEHAESNVKSDTGRGVGKDDDNNDANGEQNDDDDGARSSNLDDNGDGDYSQSLNTSRNSSLETLPSVSAVQESSIAENSNMLIPKQNASKRKFSSIQLPDDKMNLKEGCKRKTPSPSTGDIGSAVKVPNALTKKTPRAGNGPTMGLPVGNTQDAMPTEAARSGSIPKSFEVEDAQKAASELFESQRSAVLEYIHTLKLASRNPATPLPHGRLERLYQRCWGKKWASVCNSLVDNNRRSVINDTMALISAFLVDNVLTQKFPWECVALTADQSRPAVTSSMDGASLEVMNTSVENLTNCLFLTLDQYLHALDFSRRTMYFKPAEFDDTGFRQAIKGVVRKALRLNYELDRCGMASSFSWPEHGESFNPASMRLDVEDHSANNLLVAYTAFPGLSLTFMDRGGKQVTVRAYKAHVVAQYELDLE